MGRPKGRVLEFWVVALADAWFIIKKAAYDPYQMVVVSGPFRTREEALTVIAQIRERRRAIR